VHPLIAAWRLGHLSGHQRRYEARHRPAWRVSFSQKRFCSRLSNILSFRGRRNLPQRTFIHSLRTSGARSRFAYCAPPVVALFKGRLCFLENWRLTERLERAVMVRTSANMESTITCPNCGHQAVETMPVDACRFFYDCKGCGVRLKPRSGDCCVFCSYGSAPCPTSSCSASPAKPLDRSDRGLS
jgi:hypothetical protein